MSSRALKSAALAVLGAVPLAGCAAYAPLPLDRSPALVPALSSLPDAPRGAVSMHDLDRLVLANNPELRAARAKLGVARAQMIAAGALPNPQITMSYPFVVGGPDAVNAFNVGISQDLKALVLRPTKLEAAASAAAEVDASLLWQEWQTVGKARLLFTAIVFGDRALQLVGRTRKLLQDRLDHASAAINQGNGTVATLSPDLSALAETQKLHDELERQQLARRHQLNGLMGLAPDAPLMLAGASRPPRLDAAAARRDLDSLADRRPDLVALQYGYQSQDAKLRQAILAQFPSVSIGLAGGRETDGVYTLGPHVTFELPIFDRNEGAIAREGATRAALHAEFSARLTAAAGEIRALLSEQLLLQRQLARLEPRLRKAKTIAAQSEVAFRQNLLDERVYVETQLAQLTMERQKIELERALMEGRASLATLIGAGLPQVVPHVEPPKGGVLDGLTRHLDWREAMQR